MKTLSSIKNILYHIINIMDGDDKLAISMVLTTINVGLLNKIHSMTHGHQKAILIDHINQKIIYLPPH